MSGSEPTPAAEELAAAPSSHPAPEPRGAAGDYPYEGELMLGLDLRARLIAHCREGLPNEACGLLGASAEKPSVVREVVPLTNAAASPERYELDPLEQLEAYRALDDAGFSAIGVYHSHPATPARPSVTDIAEAYDPEAVYLIVSFAAEEPSVRAFSIRDRVVTELSIVTIDPAEKAGQ